MQVRATIFASASPSILTRLGLSRRLRRIARPSPPTSRRLAVRTVCVVEWQAAAAWASVIPGPACSPLSTASRMFACLVCVAGALPLSTTASRPSLSSPVRVTTYLTLAMPATSEEMAARISTIAKITT